MSRFDKLLVLDLDETLIHALDDALDRPADFLAAGYHVYERPGVRAFVAACFEMFEVAVWTASGERYASEVVAKLFDARSPSFVYARPRCTRYIDRESRDMVWLKPIVKLRKRGYPKGKILFVDDSPEKLARSYGNLVRVPPFEGDPSDAVLPALARYLETLGPVDDVRAIEKRGWLERF